MPPISIFNILTSPLQPYNTITSTEYDSPVRPSASNSVRFQSNVVFVYHDYPHWFVLLWTPSESDWVNDANVYKRPVYHDNKSV